MLKRLIGRILFHDLLIVREFGTSRKLYCRRCKRYFGMHDGVRAFIPWDGELDALYAFMDSIQEK